MSYVIAVPDTVAAAAADLAGIGSSVSAAHVAAAAPTTAVIAAAGDEVSAAIASLFSNVGTEFQALSTQAATFHARFVQALTGAGGAYAAAEAANASPLQALAAPAQTVQDDIIQVIGKFLSLPLIGNGANGTAASPNGQPGGILFGNG